MNILFRIILATVIVTHLYIFTFEMFLWESRGPKIFSSFPKKLFLQTKALAANQGLYNGFLAAGLIWTLFITDPIWSVNISIFFLSCIVIAGIYGAFTAERKIFVIQALPAILALFILCIK